MMVGDVDAPAAPSLTGSELLEEEVDRIQKTADLQLASLHGLNASLAKKIRVSEARAKELLELNRQLEDNNTTLVDNLNRAKDDLRTLSLAEGRLAALEEEKQQAASAAIAAELAVKKQKAQFDSLQTERDALASELDTFRRRAAELDEKLKAAEDKNVEEKTAHDADVQQRSLDFATLSQQKEDHQKNRETLEQTLQQRELDLKDSADKLLVLQEENDKAANDAEAKLQEAEQRLAEVRLQVQKADEELNDLKVDCEEAQAEKLALSETLDALTTEKKSLEERVEVTDRDLVKIKGNLDTVQTDRDDVQEDLDAKIAEATKLAADIAQLGVERDDLQNRCDGLEKEIEEARKETETTKSELDNRNLAFAKVESHRNLLQGEKSTLEKDFTEVRDLSTLLKRDKGHLEIRVYELEELEKKLMAIIAKLKEEKAEMLSEHDRELRERIREKDAEFARETVELRKELDDVVDRHAAVRNTEMEREAAASAAAAERAAAATAAAAAAAASTEFVDDSAAMEDRMVVGPDVPMDVPEAPTPFEVRKDEDTVDSGGIMVMTREVVVDDDDDDMDALDEDPEEGDTMPGIVSEEVVEEVVLDSRDDDNALEEVEEEVALPAAEAALAMGMKDSEVVEEVAVAFEVDHSDTKKVDDAPVGIVHDADDFDAARDAGMDATTEKRTTFEAVRDAGKDAATSTRDAAAAMGGRAKRSGSKIWKKALCCVGPSRDGK